MKGVPIGAINLLMAGRGVGKSLLFKAVYGGALTDNELRAIPKELRDALGLRGTTFKGNK